MTSLLRWTAFSAFLLSACSSIIGTDTQDDVLRPDATAPQNLTAQSTVDAVAIDLAWSGAQYAAGYRIYRSEGPANLSPAAVSGKSRRHAPTFQMLAEVTAETSVATVKTLTYNDTAVKAGVHYNYRVRAVSDSGRESEPSNLASAKPGPVGPEPTAPALTAPKNEQATSQVAANDPREKITHTFTISAAPVSGTATISPTGLVTYTPLANWEGKDEMKVTVTASDKRAGTVTIPILIGNRPPSPVAGPISIAMNGVGSSQVLAGDPDKADTHTFAIVQQPAFGEATISAGGLVTYTSAVNQSGQTQIVVRVTDNGGAMGSAAIPVVVGGAVPTNGPALPGVYCADGGDHVMLTRFSIAQGTVLAPDTDYEFTAEVSYALASVQKVGVYILGNFYQNDVADACGMTTVTGTFHTGGDNTTVDVRGAYGTSTDWVFDLLVAADPLQMPELGIVNTTFPTYDGYLLDAIQYEWMTTFTYNVNRSNGIWSTFFEVDEDYGQGSWYPYFAPINVGTYTRSVRLRSTPACGDDRIQFEAYLSNDISGDSYQVQTIPIAPPAVATRDYYVNYPLLQEDQTVQVQLDDCTGTNPTVQLRPSAAFFTVDQETVTLPATVNLTYHVAEVGVGQLAEGVLEIISETGAFSTKTLPVSARRFDYDLNDWTYAACTVDCGSDDGERTVPLSFKFPYADTWSTQVYASTNGALFFDNDSGNVADYGNLDGSFNDLDPNYFSGSPFVAFFWTDNRVGYNWNRADRRQDWSPGVYYRDHGTYVEILYWDFFSYSDYTNRQVMLHRVYDDGHIELTYPMINPTGVESVIAYAGNGRATQIWDVWSIQNGATLSVSPLPAQ